MNVLIICSKIPKDAGVLRDSFRAKIGHTMEDWNIQCIRGWKELVDVQADAGVPEICCIDVMGQDEITTAEEARRRFPKALIVVVTSPRLSPAAYIRPDVMPSGVLFKPLSKQQAESLAEELLRHVRAAGRKQLYGGAVFPVTSHGCAYRIPLEDILYFEARNKRIFLYTQNAEVEFYDTLERLMGRLDRGFLRCHKSFVINQYAVERVSLAENLIYLGDGSVQIPISRSCKAAVKEVLT